MKPGPDRETPPPGSHRRIESEHLVLAPIPRADALALLAGREVPTLVAGCGWPTADTLGGLALEVTQAVASHETDDTGDTANHTGWFVVLRSSGAVIGDCGWLGGPNADGTAEIGYGLAAPYRGRGYGTEAVGALVSWCRRQPGVRRLVADVLPANAASRRLLASLSFQQAEPNGDHVRYVLPTAYGT